ncbi:MAG: uracil phosphoribosyltransferase [Selenomonadaceae bacterium]|nr:uracil phosphoribosyltransferase [Selenomonadaceae bacterium]
MIKLIQHPVLTHKLTLLRRKETPSKVFRATVEELSELLTYEATRELALRETEIETPITRCTAQVLAEEKFVIVPILRAGLAMVAGALKILPDAAVGHIGLVRDETTHKPVEYYRKIPANLAEKTVLVVDPMLATGGSTSAALKILKEHGARKIIFVNIIAAPEGIKKIADEHSEIPIYTAAIDDHLNEKCYIVPGLGDAGDRIFGTGSD